MEFLRKSDRRLVKASFCRHFPRTVQFPRSRGLRSNSTRSLAHFPMEENAELFEYTSGRWIWNDAFKHSERRRTFNVSEFKRFAAAAVNQNVEDIASFQKLAEGGFNRTFLITMRDGFQFVGRIPYSIIEPKRLVIASEVATIDFLRLHNIPVPYVYSYSTTSENAAGTEYVFMELVQGTNLGDIWLDMSEKARITIVTKLVELESRLFALEFPACGSLYYTKDLQAGFCQVKVPIANSAHDSDFCIGPDTRLGLWHGRRGEIEIDRGPYTDPAAALIAGAKKEIAYLTKFGRPLHPFQRLRREIYNYRKQLPLDHLDSLDKYLRIAPYLIPQDNESLIRSTLRHPDLQPNNVFISDKLEITGLIDWQHCAILPLFVQCGIPNSLQNYGDSISESLTNPALPANFDDLDDGEQFEQVLILRKRQLHYFYVAMTAKLNATHYDALAYDFSILRRKLFDHASYPWEGDNITLKADLVQLLENWSRITAPEPNVSHDTKAPCPISFTKDEITECKRLNAAQSEADEQLQVCRDIIGIGLEGWVPEEHYEKTNHRAIKLKVDALEAAESEEERMDLSEHWIFDDFDEEEYS